MQNNILFKPAKRVTLILCILIVSFSSCSFPGVKINDLKVEYLTDPLGVDTDVPRFSWKLDSEQRSVYQQAYQLIVGESPGEIRKGSGNVWDSGKINSGQTVNIEYDGAPLQSNRKYYWRVRVWTDSDEYEWSEPAFFHTGILDETEWEAEWITTREEIIDASPLMRKEFPVDRRIEEAYVFVTARGFYELYLNGEKVGDHVLDPAITDYRETILYSTFDVTNLLKRGNNVAGAVIGNGAWNLRRTEGRYSWGSGGQSFGNPGFLMQLMITYSDGSKSIIVTDNTWKYSGGPVTFNNLYGGEDYDARKETDGWSLAGFDDTGWKPVTVATEPAGRLKSLMMPPLRVTKTIQPVKELNPSPGVYLFDLGQNIAGWWRIELKGAPGQVIRVRADETLNDTVPGYREVIFPKPMEEGDKLSTNARYHTTIWTDYTLKGNVSEVYEPRFFYTGFRYIEVTTSDQKDLEHLKVEGRVVRTAVERNGTFESSDSLLNQIHRAGLWSQKGNFHSYPTDCPQREKGAYLGDGQVMVEASMHDFHMAPFYTKWVNDMRDAKEESGRIPNTAPVLVGGMGGGIAWGSAYILIPWWMHNYYQDTRILAEHYPTMKEYLDFLKFLATTETSPEEPYIIDANFYGYWYSLGEWVSPGRRDCPNHSVVHTFYYYYNSLLLSKIAEVLGYSDDSDYFQALSDTIKQEFNRKFFNPETSLYGTEEAYQTYQLLALAGDVVPDEFRESVFNTIVEDIEQRGGHLNTGIIGTKYLWPVLVQNGRDDLAFLLATQTTYPGYGYWIENNMTTLAEQWDGSNSKNHHMFGSVVEYFFKHLAGIQSPTDGCTSKGYQDIYIKPYVPAGLNYVNASYETVTGEIFSGWNKESNSFTHIIEIPANTTATVALPVFDFGEVSVYEGDAIIWENNSFVEGTSGIIQVIKELERIMIQIESGKYRFRMERD